MIIAIGSGKGGTGKTTIATALSRVLHERDVQVSLGDCDVEAPNAHLFLKPEWDEQKEVTVTFPKIDGDRCTRCGACSSFCRFHALAINPAMLVTFPELCHACGGCARLCPEEAISYEQRPVGEVRSGEAGGLRLVQGRINVGEPRSTPLIAEVRRRMPKTEVQLLDAPPGTSCPFVEAIEEADICLLVAEPTRFGVHDLELALEVTDTLDVPRAVLVNRSDLAGDGIDRLCERHGVPILLRIPHDRAIAEAYAAGQDILAARPGLADELWQVFVRLKELAATHKKAV